MAALPSTQIIANSTSLPTPVGPNLVEFWRVQLGSVADTITITPSNGRFVIAALGCVPASNNLTSLGINTNVTFTLLASGATTATCDVMLIVQQ
jgi:hypothetical protein